MKLNLKFAITLFFAFFTVIAKTQTSGIKTETNLTHKCGTKIPPAEWDTWFNKNVEIYQKRAAQNKTEQVSYTIPVIVHIIHGGQAVGSYPNISTAQVKSQIVALNKDFAGVGTNINNLASTGFSLVGAANCLVSFCLAQLDPNGNALSEPGIDRRNYNSNGWANPASMTTESAFFNLMDNTIKANTIWDPTRYFNIWVSDINSGIGILGYATLPNGSGLIGLTSVGTANDDGIWIWGRAFGTVGTATSPFNLGRTASHETGHWLGLRHIGGDPLNPSGDCNATDYCNDTPPQKGGYAGGANGQNYGSPTYPLFAGECGSVYGNMFMNFMDYTEDAVMYMFTPDQNTRIQTAMQNGYFRSQLSASSASLCSGIPNADILLDTILCIGKNINAINQSFGDEPLTYSWAATPSLGVTFSPSATVASPIMNFASVGMYTLTTTVSNSVGISINSIEVRLEECTGIPKNHTSVSSLNISPNPTNAYLKIDATKTSSEIKEIRIHNAIGQLIKEFSNVDVNELEINLSSYPDGIYNVIIVTNEGQMMKRIILSK